MSDQLSEKAVEALRELAEGTWSYPLAPGEVQVMETHLPDHVVLCVAGTGQGSIWIMMDHDQPDTTRHLRELLTHWPDGVDPRLAQITKAIVAALEARVREMDDSDEGDDEAGNGPVGPAAL